MMKKCEGKKEEEEEDVRVTKVYIGKVQGAVEKGDLEVDWWATLSNRFRMELVSIEHDVCLLIMSREF